jgi:hypothetical protein
MHEVKIIHVPKKPKLTEEPTSRLLLELFVRTLATLYYALHRIVADVRRQSFGAIALVLVIGLLAFKAERLLPGAEPAEYVDPLPQVPPPLEEYILATISKNETCEAEAAVKPKPALYTNKVGAIPQGYDHTQAIVWHLMAHESFRPEPYKDGAYPSVGFGLNLTPEHKKWGAQVLGLKTFPSKLTWDQGKALLYAHVNLLWDKCDPRLTPQQKVAWIVHAYNRGQGSARNIFGCCKAKTGCGSPNPRIKVSHTKRRQWEARAWRGKLTKIDIEKDRQKVLQLEKRHK